MNRFKGGSAAESGYYLDLRRWAVASLPADGKLPGSERDEFVRLPWPLVLAAVPLVGGALLVAWPVLGLATMAVGLARRATGAAWRGARDLAATVGAGQATGEAHLAGGRGKGEPVRDRKIEELEKEVGRRRREGVRK